MTQYLILHKVRGEASFDCATNIGDETGDMWITNSGYRAYPYQKWSMDELGMGPAGMTSLPADWPDHFEDKPAPTGGGLDIWSVIKRPEPKLIRRRV